jgi:hypothetical protein
MSTITRKAQEKLDRDYCKDKLLEHYLMEGQTVYTVLRSVSASGMTRAISLFIAQEGEIVDITYYAAGATGSRLVQREGYRAISVGGAGMDMGFHLVYNLASVLFHGQDRAGYELKQAWL